MPAVLRFNQCDRNINPMVDVLSRRVQALQEVQAGETQRRCCPLHPWPARVHRAHLVSDGAKMKWLWVRVRGMVEDMTVGPCYRQPNQEDQVDKALHWQTGDVAHSQVLVFMDNFNHPDISWRDNTDTSGHKHSRRFLECIDDSFLLQTPE